MALYDFAMGKFPRAGIWALTCENGCRPERPLECEEIQCLLAMHLQLALQSSAVDTGDEDYNEDEFQFLFKATQELAYPEIIRDIQSGHQDAYYESLRMELEELMFNDMMASESSGTGSASV